MSTNDKSQTIKIDIRSLGYGRSTVADRSGVEVQADYFGKLDYRFLFESAYDAILLADRHGIVLEANARATSFFQYGERERGLSGVPLGTLVAGVTSSLLEEILAVISESRYMRIQAFAVRRDGSLSAVEIVAMGNGLRVPEPVCYLIRDIQSRWQAEQRLLSVYHAMDNTDSGIGIADMEGKVVYANRMMVHLLAGGEETEVFGGHLSAWFDHKAVIVPMLANVRQRKSWIGEQRLLVNEQARWLQIAAVPDINDDDELRGMVISLRDTAERRRAEIAESQVERNRVMMESLAGVCHSLGQPATVLLTSIEILKMGGVKDEKSRQDMINLCYDAVIQLRDLLQKMNAKRLYAAEPYLPGQGDTKGMLRIEEERMPSRRV
ncbi:MAG: PAS domain S-box protein [Kiritimatiellia bacterium]|nr:PAS domain S-box protein [Kiritimatiellia bacterium]